MCRLGIFSLLVILIRSTTVGQAPGEKGVLIRVTNSATNTHGYRNEAGKIVIPMGKYSDCYTDTFRNYAIVVISGRGIVAIDRRSRVLYDVFIFDNGPDYPADGLFRIRANGKIGYADETTGKIAIKPQFACAWPFENGVAKVAMHCQTQSHGEHSIWTSDEWFYINKDGVRVHHPKSR
jgi:hypothetical protein